MEPQRKQLTLKGINRSLPSLLSDGLYAHELLNMRFKDAAWRAVGNKATVKNYAINGILDYTILRQNPVMDSRWVVGYKPVEGDVNNLDLIDIDSDTLDNTSIDTFSVAVDDIYFFGRLMVVNTATGNALYKLNEDKESFTLLERLPEGQHVFWESDSAPATDVDLLEDTATHEQQLTEVKKIMFQDRNNGLCHGHTFFRLAWRLWDNTLIQHSSLHYHHIGLSDAALSVNAGADPYVLTNYKKNKPKLKLAFSEAEREIIETYKGIVSGLVVFMSDPVPGYDLKDSLDDWDLGAGSIYKPVKKGTLDDLLRDVKGFYRVDEFGIDDMLAWELDEYGVYGTEKDMEVGNINSIETNELLPVDNFTNHILKGQDLYDYNSRLHLGNVTTIFKDCYNTGKYYIKTPSGSSSEATDLRNLVYGNGAALLRNPLDAEDVGEQDFYGATDSPAQTAGGASNYNIRFTDNQTGAIANYNNTTGVYTVAAGAAGLYTFKAEGHVVNKENMGASFLNVKMLVNDTEVDSLKEAVSPSTTVYLDFNFQHNQLLEEGDTIMVKAYETVGLSPDPTNVAEISDLTELTVIGQTSEFSFDPYFEVDIETEQGEILTRKYTGITTAFENGITMYMMTVSGSPQYFILQKEVVSYPDTRAKKIRLCLYDDDSIEHYLLVEHELFAHPYLNFAYSKPVLRDSAAVDFYEPLKVVIPTDLTTLAVHVPADVKNTTTDTNRVQVSEVNNAFLYPARYSYRIGPISNTVVRMATMSEPMSEGQYGDFPLNIFTSQGVFNLNKGNPDILYLNVSRQNLDVLLSKNALLELGGAVVYATGTGLFLLSGTQRKEISRAVEGGVDGIAGREDRWKFLLGEEYVKYYEALEGYGFLYNIFCAMDERGFAPPGYRVPVGSHVDDYGTYALKQFIMDDLSIIEQHVGGHLKSTRTDPDEHPRWDDPNTGASDTYGFKGIPTGFRDHIGVYAEKGRYSYMMTHGTVLGTVRIGFMRLYSESVGTLNTDTIFGVGSYLEIMRGGYGVRFIKEDPNTWSPGDKVTDPDGNIYNTVKIGNQVWTVEDWRSTKFYNGEHIPYVEDAEEWGALNGAGMCSYGNAPVMDNRPTCPDYFSDINFIQFMQAAVMAYDNNEMELHVINPAKDYSYVYQVEHDLWHKLKQSYDIVFRADGGRFVGIDADSYIRYLDAETNSNTPMGVCLLSRGEVFGNTGFKRIERFAARLIYIADKSYKMQMNLFASLDGREWEWVGGITVDDDSGTTWNDLLLKRTHVSARYFLVSFGAYVDKRFELSAFEADVVHKHVGKLR